MRDLPLITIVTPSYNNAKYICQAIESVLSQDYPRVEYLVMDGGSTDGSIEIIKKYADRLIWVSEKDEGQSDALNKGYHRSKGNILGWINTDDFYYPGAFRKVAEYFLVHPDVKIMYGELDELNGAGQVTKHARVVPYDYDFLLNGFNYIPQPATFFRREVFETIGDLDVSLYRCMDYDYWLRVGKHYKFGFLPETLAGLRIMEGTKGGISPIITTKVCLDIGRRYGARYFSYFRLAYWLWRLGLEDVVRWGRRFVMSRRFPKEDIDL